MRMDDFTLERSPGVRRIGLWFDVEGAEFAVLKGMARIKDRMVAMHVETAKSPMRIGQRTYDEVKQLTQTTGFVLAGTNMMDDSTWGDVVFISEHAKRQLGTGW